MLLQAQAILNNASARFEDHLSAAISDLPALPRITLATDLLLGRSQRLHLPVAIHRVGAPQGRR
jgi:hypothetical protein